MCMTSFWLGHPLAEFCESHRRKQKSKRKAKNTVQHKSVSTNIKSDTLQCLFYLIWEMFYRDRRSL